MHSHMNKQKSLGDPNSTGKKKYTIITSFQTTVVCMMVNLDIISEPVMRPG